MNAEATRLRDTMCGDIECQMRHRNVDAKALDGYRGTTGYKIVANDLMLVSAVASNYWDKIQGRCGITESDIDRSELLGMSMLRLVGLQEQAPGKVEEATDMRARAFALTLRCWDTARRAVVFVRWREGDADEIAPSLYAARKLKAQEADDQPAAQAAAPVQAVAPAQVAAPMVVTNPNGPFVS